MPSWLLYQNQFEVSQTSIILVHLPCSYTRSTNGIGIGAFVLLRQVILILLALLIAEMSFESVG